MVETKSIEEQLKSVQDVIDISLNKYLDLLPTYQDTVEVAESEIKNQYPESPEGIGKFYISLGSIAVINDIKILNSQNMKNALGFSELTDMLTNMFKKSNKVESLVPTIKESSVVFNTIYSETSLQAYSKEQWGMHIESDIKSIYKALKQPKKTDVAIENLKQFYKDQGEDGSLFTYKALEDNVLSFLEKTYSTTYQLIKPKGIVIPTEDKSNPNALVSAGDSEGKIDKTASFSGLFRQIAKSLNDEFGVSKEVEINTTNNTFAPKAVLNSEKRVFFVLPHLKLLFGRNLNSASSLEIGSKLGHRKYNTWNKAQREVKLFVEDAFERLVIYFFRTDAKDWCSIDDPNTDIMEEIQKSDNFSKVTALSDKVQDAFQRLANSMVTTYFVSEFSGTNEAPSKIAIRGTFKENQISTQKFFTDMTREAHISLTEENKVKFTPRKQMVPVALNGLVNYQYEHTFNEASASAVPLFAATALDYIKQNIPDEYKNNPDKEISPITWKKLLVGMNTNGFIEQGQANVKLVNHLVHWLSAGSRAGKGVLSYNMILSLLQENRLFFYNDRKPDTSIVLAQQAGMTDGKPNLALVNGGQYNSVSEENKKYIDWQEEAINKHKPEWLNIKDRATLDDFVYLRQAMVVMGLIYAYSNAGGMGSILEKLDLPNDYVEGISAVFDEYTNYQKSFLERLDPFSSSNSLLSSMKNDDVWDLLKDKDGKGYKTLKNNNALKDININNVWRLTIMDSLLQAKADIGTIARAGIQTFIPNIDIIMIGQGFRGQKSKNVYDLPKSKNDGGYNKTGVFPGLNEGGDHHATDPLTTLIKILPEQDNILGTPPNQEPGQIYDLIDAEGRNSDTYGDYLNRNYRGFAYITDNQIKTNQKDQGYIFKPFLLLNEGSETPNMKEMAKTGKMDAKKLGQDVTNYKDQPGGYMAFLAQSVNEIPGTDWLKVRREIKDTLHLDEKGESLAGVLPYSKEIGLDASKYKRTLVVMDKVVEKMGYPGTYQEFICDTRPEWTIGVQDIEIAVMEGKEAFYNRDTLSPLRNYVQSSQFNKKTDTVDTSIIGLPQGVTPGASEEDVDTNVDSDESEVIGDHFIPEDDQTEETEEEKGQEDKIGGKNSENQDDSQNNKLDEEKSDVNTAKDIPDEEGVTEQEEKSEERQNKDKDDTKKELDRDKEYLKNNKDDIDVPKKDNKVEKPEEQTIDINSPEQQEFRYLGMEDAQAGNLAYTSRNKEVLQNQQGLQSYQRGYQEGFKISKKRQRIENLCNYTSFPEAEETADLLKLRQASQVFEDFGAMGKGIGAIKSNQRDVMKEPIYRNMQINTVNKLNEDTQGYYGKESTSGYGIADSYVINGKLTQVTNLDDVIRVSYKPVKDVDTGKVDIDKTLQDYIQRVTEDIINKVGSYKQFHRIVVTESGEMLINGMFKVHFGIPADEYAVLPKGIKMIVDQEQWGKLFSWQELRQMPDLDEVDFDSSYFVRSYVRPYFKSYQDFNQITLLRELKQIRAVAIAGEVKLREDLQDEPVDMGSWWRDKFQLTRDTTASMFNKYNQRRNDKFKQRQAERRASTQAENAKQAEDTKESDEPMSRVARRRAEKEQNLDNGINDLKDALHKGSMRNTLSGIGYCLKVIPGVFMARHRAR